jgi:hypothetical protein
MERGGGGGGDLASDMFPRFRFSRLSRVPENKKLEKDTQDKYHG